LIFVVFVIVLRKWKEIVDDWVRLNPQGEHASSGLMGNIHHHHHHHHHPVVHSQFCFSGKIDIKVK
jgi:hypothetical protein